LIPPLRLVLDTNVILSALLWGGKPAELLSESVTPRLRLFSSQWMLDELIESLGKPKLAERLIATGLTPAEHAENYRGLATLVEHGRLARPASRDADDDFVLACAIAAKADAIVTGDRDLLVLGAWDGVLMLNVNDCLEVVAALHDVP
jgi:uncharacterized protein